MYIFHIRIIIQAKIIIVTNLPQQIEQSLKCTLPGFDENFANLCAVKLKYTLADNR